MSFFSLDSLSDQMRDIKLVKQPDQHLALPLSLLLDHDHYLERNHDIELQLL
jgi:hypothetical protein